jgi:ABC-type transporter Mla subunit MlaD
LTKEGVIGATIIELSAGSEAAVVLAQDSEIGFEHGGLGRVVDDLYRDLAPLIADIKRIARNADALIAGLPATQQKLDAVLTSAARNLQNLEKVTASDLPAISRSGRDTVEGAKKVVDSLSRTWPISGNIESPQPGLLPLDSYSSPRVPAEPKP